MSNFKLDWLAENRLKQNVRSGTIILPAYLFYQSELRSDIKSFVRAVAGECGGDKALTYEEQYLNEDGSNRDYPKDMENKFIIHLDGDQLYLIPDSLFVLETE